MIYKLELEGTGFFTSAQTLFEIVFLSLINVVTGKRLRIRLSKSVLGQARENSLVMTHYR